LVKISLNNTNHHNCGDFFLYYHGQLDDSRPGNNIPLSGKDLRSAVKDLNQENSYPSNQMPS